MTIGLKKDLKGGKRVPCRSMLWLCLLQLAVGKQLLGHSLEHLAAAPRCRASDGVLLWVDSMRAPGRIRVQEVQLGHVEDSIYSSVLIDFQRCSSCVLHSYMC